MATARRYSFWLVVLLTLPVASVVRADDSSDAIAAAKPASAPQSVLYLTDGDYFTGVLKESSETDVVRWQTAGAAVPFQFPVAGIRAAYFPPPAKPAPAEADFCFELTDGDRLFGSLASISPDLVEVESPRYGRLSIERSQIRRLVPWQGAAAWEYSGPNELADWKHSPQKDGWVEEAGHLVTSSASASLKRRIKIPQQAMIELAVSWNKKLDFMFVIADGAGDKRSENRGVHLEVWDDSLVLVRETGDNADLATIADLKSLKNRLHLQIFVDQQKGSVAVHSLDGAKLGEIVVAAENDEPLEWLQFRNHRGDMRLEQLVVGKWSGQLPPQVDVTRERIQKTDGSIVYGTIVRYEPESRQFTIKDGDTETTVSHEELANAAFIPPTVPLASGSIRVGCHDGSRLSGQLAEVQGDKIRVVRPGIKEPVVFALADVRCLLGASNKAAEPTKDRSVGRLEFEGVRSHGTLVDGKSDENTSCLVWKPIQSTSSSPLEHGVSGRIVYRDPPVQVKLTEQQLQRQRQIEQQQAQRRGVIGAVLNAFSGPPSATAKPARVPGYPHTIYLLAGDRIPCIISRIDERGVHFTSSIVESGMIPNEQIKALELIPRTAAPTLAAEKQSRLLTLPRMQKNNPPTHLIASSSGDYLRARLQSMDAHSVVAETRLESKRIARGRVATVIWLHPETDAAQAEVDAKKAPAHITVQAIRADGVRLTFVPHEFAKDTLIGSSELLGPCQVDVKTVDRILIGDAIEQTTDEGLYGEWQLAQAIEPKFLNEEAASDAPASVVNSPLIGKPAPEIRLDLLEGGRYKLSDDKGQIVVLDFWATWCAPCMQSMPELIQVTQEFKDQNVKYVAVNMQEDRATIAATLERAKLNPIVALDVDGAAAEHYEVSAVPQVVIVDANGNVARMFIGVEPNFGEQLRQTIKQLLKPATPPANEAAGQ